MKDLAKNIFVWFTVAVILVIMFSNFKANNNNDIESLTYTQFLTQLEQDNIDKVTIANANINGTLNGGQKFKTFMPIPDPYILGDLLSHNVDVVGKPPKQESLWLRILISWFPFLLLIGLWVFFMRSMGGGAGGRGVMSFGRNRAKMLTKNQIKVTFKDVAGCQEAKEEVREVVDFLREPSKYQKLGGLMPRGVLLVGPPGTGKTLLAKAVAGEAKVPFFNISGSDFVEMFVGVGASRVRDMFAQAKKNAPCIIFIDEIDAVGRHRGAGLGGGHDEREQTLNQLLVEMDGFEGSEGVIVFAATNRPDVLDPALLRPGRFDRQVTVGLPDIIGREEILRVHMRKVPSAESVDARVIARGTPGFSGADLANLVNEAALFAARHNKRVISTEDFEKAKDKIMMGAERKSMVMDEDAKRLTAYHEAGHAIVAYFAPEHDPVHKVTIMPRGRALGVTLFLPEQDRYNYSKQRLESQLCSMYGGRIAEELIFGEDNVTTGASNDIERATEIARNMVIKWGFSKIMGPLSYGEDQDEVFVGRYVSQQRKVSEEAASAIDKEVREIIEHNYSKAKTVLQSNMSILHAMAKALMQYETLNRDQIEDLMHHRSVRDPEGWHTALKPNKPTAPTDTSKPAVAKSPTGDQPVVK